MNVFPGIFLLLVPQFSRGEVKHLRPGGIIDHDINDSQIFNSLANQLKTIAPNELMDEKGMTLVNLTKAQSQVVRGIRWIYKFEAKGLSSNNLYSCKMEVLQQIWRTPDCVNYFHCNKLEI